MKTYKIATIPGDGIGKEVVPAGQQVLEALASASSSFRFEFENFDWGGDYFREHGVMMMTRAGVERIMRFAFKLAQSRPRKLLTVITKSNAQRHAMVMWDEIAVQISKEFPDVKWDKELVDASTARMINNPASLDTIV